MRSRDNQRRAVYCWEDKILKRWPSRNCQLADVECLELVRRVWRDYRPGEEPPKIVLSTRAKRWARGSRSRITLPKGWARKTIVVLHETAHSLLPLEQHGPKFASLVLELWSKYSNIPYDEAKSIGTSQKPRRVKFALAADGIGKPTKEWQKWHEMKKQIERMLQICIENEPDMYEET